MADNKGNKRIGSFNFDAETKLEVMQRGGGGAGVGGENGLAAVNLVTGESTNDALAEKDETIEEQAATIEEQAGTIEQQAGEISDLEDEVAAKQAIIDAFPTIEALNVTANGTYNEEGKAYKPVTVAVPEGYVLDTIANSGGVTLVNNTANDLHCADFVVISEGSNTPQVVAKIVTIPANSSATLTVLNKKYLKKDGYAGRYDLYFLENMTNYSVAVTGSGTAEVSWTSPMLRIKFLHNVTSPSLNYTVTITTP